MRKKKGKRRRNESDHATIVDSQDDEKGEPKAPPSSPKRMRIISPPAARTDGDPPQAQQMPLGNITGESTNTGSRAITSLSQSETDDAVEDDVMTDAATMCDIENAKADADLERSKASPLPS